MSQHLSILGRRSKSAATALAAHAESVYTFRRKSALAALALLSLTSPLTLKAQDKSSHDLYQSLNALRIDPAAVYSLKPEDHIDLHRSDAKLYFEEGKLAFFAALDGRITGAVFSGRGHVLATPRDLAEKQQLGRFLGSPLLDQNFNSAYLRFTDDATEELLRELQAAHLAPQSDADFAGRWDTFLAHRNAAHSLRILLETLSQDPKPYFSANLDGAVSGPFDFLFDWTRSEQFLLGQPRTTEAGDFYDIWACYKVPGSVTPQKPFRATHYSIETSILPNNSLEAKADVRVHSDVGVDRVIVFQLARTLGIASVADENGQPLAFFQNEGMSAQERNTHGNDLLYVVLPVAPARGQEFTLRFHYRGNVIEDAGNGVLFVGARESWYPHLGETADFSAYDLTMRWPRRLRLVATGAKLDEREDGDFRVGHWRTERPVAVAGFNLGDYASASFVSATHSVDVYANRVLEEALKKRLPAARQFRRFPSVAADTIRLPQRRQPHAIARHRS